VILQIMPSYLCQIWFTQRPFDGSYSGFQVSTVSWFSWDTFSHDMATCGWSKSALNSKQKPWPNRWWEASSDLARRGHR
jgi:hypothetical protein